MVTFDTLLLAQYFYNIAVELESLLSFTFVLSSLRRQRERVREREQARKRSRGEKVGWQSIKRIFLSSKNSWQTCFPKNTENYFASKSSKDKSTWGTHGRAVIDIYEDDNDCSRWAGFSFISIKHFWMKSLERQVWDNSIKPVPNLFT